MKLKRGWDGEGGAVENRIESLTEKSALTDDSPFTSFMLCYVSIFNVYQMNCEVSGEGRKRSAKELRLLGRGQAARTCRGEKKTGRPHLHLYQSAGNDSVHSLQMYE